MPLLLFFTTATVWTKVAATRRKRSRTADAKGRKAVQVAANGAVASGAIVGFALAPAAHWLAAFAGALAAVTADTWATEIGAFSPDKPRLITTGERVTAGRSGAISLTGTAGGIAGAIVLAAGAAVSFTLWPPGLLADGGRLGLVAAVGGIFGLFADSLLGATVQAHYFCPQCRVLTEERVHRCGTRGRLVGGLSFCTNDVVNFFASFVGAVSASLLYLLG